LAVFVVPFFGCGCAAGGNNITAMSKLKIQTAAFLPMDTSVSFIFRGWFHAFWVIDMPPIAHRLREFKFSHRTHALPLDKKQKCLPAIPTLLKYA
jgi:hypothetical protein